MTASSTTSAAARDEAVARADLVGRYRAGSVDLELFADGRYHGEISAMVDMCLTVKGNGCSRGRFEVDGESLRFEASHDESTLAFAFEEAVVVRDPAGLRLVTSDRDVAMRRLEPGDGSGVFGIWCEVGR